MRSKMRGAKKVTLAFVDKTNHSAFWQVDDVPRKFENFENILVVVIRREN